MMDCKKALEEANGNQEEAITILRKKGVSKAAKKSDRETSEGMVFLAEKPGVKALFALGCETDFVSRNEQFQAFGKKYAEMALENDTESKEDAIKNLPDLIGVIGENMSVIGCSAFKEGTLGSYVHSNGKIGVLVSLHNGNEECANDIAMHIAALNPQFLSPAEVCEDTLKKEKEIWIDQLKQEGKPENIIENILKGKEKKFREESALLTQPFVKDSSVTVEEYAKQNGASVQSFIRFSL
jgi:elongation factor Ts